MQPNKSIGDSENIDGWLMAIQSLRLRRGLMLLIILHLTAISRNGFGE